MLYDFNRQLIYAGGLVGEIYVISCLSGSIIYYFVGHRQNILHLSISRYNLILFDHSVIYIFYDFYDFFAD